MTKPGKKSILASFAAYTATAPAPAADEGERHPTEPSHLANRVGAGVIGATQRSLTELREERDRLRAAVAAGGSTEIDPSLIDPSPFPDRLPDDGEEDFIRFKDLLASEGQLVPIQVRHHPSAAERYQVVYGHRRWRAARELGIKVKAIVVNYDDRELAIAQGIENAARQDLTWIEKALFAARMDEAGVKARDIRAALNIDDPELARFRSVIRAVPADVIGTIGRAPKAGRTRWLELATASKAEGDGLERIRQTLAAAKVSSSDERFVIALDASRPPAESALPSPAAGLAMKTRSGRSVGQIAFSRNVIKVSLVPSEAEAFRTFIEADLANLLDRYEASKRAE